MIITILGVIKPNIVEADLETNTTIEVADTYLWTTIALVIMDPYEPEALIRFNASISLNGL